MGTVKNRAWDRVVQSSTLLLFSIGVIFVLLLTIPRGDSLWAGQLRVDAQVNGGIWITPTETPTATSTFTETPTPTLTPTETPLELVGTSIEVKLTARGFKAGDVDPVFGVEGQVCVINIGEISTENLTIHDIVEIKSTAGPFEKFFDFSVDVSGRPVLEPGMAYCFPYFKSFTPSEDPEAKYRNSAEVTITNHSGWMPGGKHCPGPELCPFGSTEKEDFDFSDLLVDARPLLMSTLTETPTPTVTPTDTLTMTPSDTSTETLVDILTLTYTPMPTETPTASLTFTPIEEVIPPTDTPTPEPPPTDTPVPVPPPEESPPP